MPEVPPVPEVPAVLYVRPRRDVVRTFGTLGTPRTSGGIRVGAFLVVFLLTAGASYAFAQQPPDGLNDQQRLGRQVLAQSCGVCHLPPARNARTYGPALNKGTLGGDDGLARKVIAEGTPRMPGFKYMLQPAEIDAIVAFIRTLPASAPVRGSAVLPEEAPPPRRAEPTP